MLFFSRDKYSENDRKKSLQLGYEIVRMQLQVAKAAGIDIYDASHTYYSLGYFFGVFQAGLESLTSKQITQVEYEKHISEGYEIIFQHEGKNTYEVARKYLENEEFRAGQIAGVTEYVEIKNGKENRAYALAQYMLN